MAFINIVINSVYYQLS